MTRRFVCPEEKLREGVTFGNLPTDMRIPPLKIQILIESNPLKSRNLVTRLAVGALDAVPLGEAQLAPFTGRSFLRCLLLQPTEEMSDLSTKEMKAEEVTASLHTKNPQTKHI